MGLLRNIYLYVVSFVSLMITVTAVITAFNSISDMIIPDSEVYNYDYTYPAYDYNNAGVTDDDYALQKPNQEEVAKQEKKIEVRRAQKSLINSLAAVLVGGVTYWFHWTRIEREHKKKIKETT